MKDFIGGTFVTVFILALIGGIIAGLCIGIPNYNVYKSRLDGEAEFVKAEENRRITIEEAKAKLEAAKFEAGAEVERAKGVAEANRIIGDSLTGNEAYLRYLWIQGLHDGTSETIYIPTEAQLPILEAVRGVRDAPLAEPEE